jgi:hypothetical protein
MVPCVPTSTSVVRMRLGFGEISFLLNSGICLITVGGFSCAGFFTHPSCPGFFTHTIGEISFLLSSGICLITVEGPSCAGFFTHTIVKGGHFLGWLAGWLAGWYQYQYQKSDS